jgi:Zn-finger nucleic acid-binding protein
MRTQDAVNAMLCPVCRTGLALSDRGGVEIDYCPSCRGVWLDRGELDKIIERTGSSQSPYGSDLREPRRSKESGLVGLASSLLRGDDDRYDYHGRDDRHYRNKRKSKLSDFFD